MWRDIKDYEGLYEINENAVVRRVEGKGIDGRKVTTHVVVSSKTRKGTRYIASVSYTHLTLPTTERV